MDFNDTPQEAEFRAAARGWLDSNAERLGPDESPTGMAEGQDREDVIKSSQAWQARKADAGPALPGLRSTGAAEPPRSKT